MPFFFLPFGYPGLRIISCIPIDLAPFSLSVNGVRGWIDHVRYIDDSEDSNVGGSYKVRSKSNNNHHVSEGSSISWCKCQVNMR